MRSARSTIGEHAFRARAARHSFCAHVCPVGSVRHGSCATFQDGTWRIYVGYLDRDLSDVRKFRASRTKTQSTKQYLEGEKVPTTSKSENVGGGKSRKKSRKKTHRKTKIPKKKQDKKYVRNEIDNQEKNKKKHQTRTSNESRKSREPTTPRAQYRQTIASKPFC